VNFSVAEENLNYILFIIFKFLKVFVEELIFHAIHLISQDL